MPALASAESDGAKRSGKEFQRDPRKPTSRVFPRRIVERLLSDESGVRDATLGAQASFTFLVTSLWALWVLNGCHSKRSSFVGERLSTSARSARMDKVAVALGAGRMAPRQRNDVSGTRATRS